jgi:predicted NBD/HSP70 family sugar kinase
VFVVKVIDAALREAGVGRAHVLSVGGAVGAKNTVALLAGHRLGAGVVTVGTLLRGANGGVGEVFVLRHIQGGRSAYGIGHRLEAWPPRPWRRATGSLPAGHPLRTLPADAVTARALVGRAGAPETQGEARSASSGAEGAE